MFRSARILFSLSALIAIATPSAAFANDAERSSQAPADRYFGRLAMSPIGIFNAIGLASSRIDGRRTDAREALEGLAYVEDAIRDWESHYPHDTWLPRALGSLDTVYRKLDDPGFRDADDRIDRWLETKYATSAQAEALGAREAYASDPTPSVLRP